MNAPPGKPDTASTLSLDVLTMLRGGATVLIVLAHTCIAYMMSPPPGIPWPVYEPDPSGIADSIFLWCRGSQCVFFVLAGTLIASVAEHLRPRSLCRNRLRLLGRPLVIGVFTVLLLCYPIWMLGWWRTGYIKGEQALHFRLSTPDKNALLGFAHLWFLEYLLIYSLAFGAWRWVTGRRGPMVMSTIAGVTAIIGVLVWIFAWAWFDPAMISDFRNSFLPQGPYFAFNAGFFFLGLVLWSVRDRIPRNQRLWEVTVLLAQVACVVWWVLRARDASGVPAAAAVSVFAFLSAVGWPCLALVVKLRPWFPRALFTSLARSGYWVYLTHLPFVALACVLLYSVPIPGTAKVALGTAAGVMGPIGVRAIWLRARA